MADEKDDLEDLLDDRATELEARFRELEQEAEIERLRQRGGASPGQPASKSRAADSSSDPLADLKQAMDSDAPLPRYLLVVCPHCAAKNRLSLNKVRTLNPLCGACRRELAFQA